MIQCCCPTECAAPTVSVGGCGDPHGSPIPIDGASVSYVQAGVTYGPWTTDAAGHAVISVAAAGSAVFTIVPPSGSGYATLTQTVTLSCTLTVYNFTLALAAGYRCNPPACCTPATTATGPPYEIAVVSWPTTLYLNDGFGAIACPGGGEPPLTPNYSGFARRTAAIGQQMITDDTGCHYDLESGVEVTVYYRIHCSSTGEGSWTVTGFFAIGTPCPYQSCPTVSPRIAPAPWEFPLGVDDASCGFLGSSGQFGAGCSYVWSFEADLVACPPGSIGFSGSCSFHDGANDGPSIPNCTYPGFQVYGSTARITVSS